MTTDRISPLPDGDIPDELRRAHRLATDLLREVRSHEQALATVRQKFRAKAAHYEQLLLDHQGQMRLFD